MSMLAAPKRKQKWTLNPRGKQWSEDSTKFGQKMLEKMGWSSGKGLGAKEQGMVEHVRVKVKNDQVGIGFAKNKDDQWTEHQEDFNSFLQNLQKEQSAQPLGDAENKDKVLSGTSLEEKSKNSQKRVHYKKFTRGKDVNKYSTKDLANIFGKKDLDDKPRKVEEEDDEKADVGTKDTTAGVVTIKGGNMNEYFSKKLGTSESNKARELINDSESEADNRAGFGFSQKSRSKFYLNDDANNENSCGETDKYKGFGFIKSTETKSKNKKLNNLNYVFDNPCLDLNILDSSLIKQEKMNEDFESSSTIKMPKKRKNEDTDDETLGTPKSKKQKNGYVYENKGLDLECTDSSTIKQENDITEKPKKDKRSKKLNNQYENQGMDVQFLENSLVKQDKTDDDFESTVKMPKKRKNEDIDEEPSGTAKSEKQKNGYVYENKGLDLKCPDSSAIKKESVVFEKPKKSKKSKKLNNQYENQGMDVEFLESVVVINDKNVISSVKPSVESLEVKNDATPKKSKKSKSTEIVSNGIENPALDLNSSDKSRPKKNKKNKNLEDLCGGIENPGLDLEFSDKPTPKKSKKNTDSKITFNGIENPALDLDFPDSSTPNKSKKKKDLEVLSAGIENPGLDLEFPDKPTPKKSKRRNNQSETLPGGLENPALDLSYPENDVYDITAFEVPRTCGVENDALNLSDDNSRKKRVTFNDEIEYSTDSVNKKKKKLDKYEVVNEKSKKKKASKEPVTFVNEALDIEVINVEEADNEVNERKSKKCKRKRERRISLLETIEEAPEEENCNEVSIEDEQKRGDVEIVAEFPCNNMQEVEYEDSAKKKSKKKKSRTRKEQTEETEVVDEIIEEIDLTEKETKKKKKKKKEKPEAVEDVEKNKSEDPGKENICNAEDSENADYKKKKYISSEDVISLEEFLNEGNLQKKQETTSVDALKSETKDNSKNFSFQRTQSFKTPKQIMKSLFFRDPTVLFKGSNINEIKGYGVNVFNN